MHVALKSEKQLCFLIKIRSNTVVGFLIFLIFLDILNTCSTANKGGSRASVRENTVDVKQSRLQSIDHWHGQPPDTVRFRQRGVCMIHLTILKGNPDRCKTALNA